MSLADALAERVNALARSKARLQALDDQTADHVVQEPDADAVLRQALDVLSTRDGYEAAMSVVRGEDVAKHDGLARAGLVVWDPASDAVRPTPLLIELIKVLDR